MIETIDLNRRIRNLRDEIAKCHGVLDILRKNIYRIEQQISFLEKDIAKKPSKADLEKHKRMTKLLDKTYGHMD